MREVVGNEEAFDNYDPLACLRLMFAFCRANGMM